MTVLEMRTIDATHATHATDAIRAAGTGAGSHTATVTGSDGVLFVATSVSRLVLEASLAEYVETRCDDVLWPADAAEVRSLLAAGNAEAAVVWYFAHVGARWDDERLELGRNR